MELGPWLQAAADLTDAGRAGALLMWRFRYGRLILGAQLDLPPIIQVSHYAFTTRVVAICPFLPFVSTTHQVYAWDRLYAHWRGKRFSG